MKLIALPCLNREWTTINFKWPVNEIEKSFREAQDWILVVFEANQAQIYFKIFLRHFQMSRFLMNSNELLCFLFKKTTKFGGQFNFNLPWTFLPNFKIDKRFSSPQDAQFFVSCNFKPHFYSFYKLSIKLLLTSDQLPIWLCSSSSLNRWLKARSGIETGEINQKRWKQEEIEICLKPQNQINESSSRRRHHKTGTRKPNNGESIAWDESHLVRLC